MREESSVSRAGYLRENYHYFHLRDTAGQELDFHFHEFDKIVLLLSGRVDYTVEGSSYALKPWSVLLVKHHTIHKAMIDKSEPYERIIIYLDGKYFDRILPGVRLTDSFDQADKRGEHLLRPTARQRQSIEEVLAAYESAGEDGGFGAQALRETYIMQLLIYIGRMTAAKEPGESQYDPKIRRVLSYINENLGGELRVEQLAEFSQEQLEGAGAVLVNKSDLVTEEILNEVDASIRTYNADAAIFHVSALQGIPDTVWRQIFGKGGDVHGGA